MGVHPCIMLPRVAMCTSSGSLSIMARMPPSLPMAGRRPNGRRKWPAAGLVILQSNCLWAGNLWPRGVATTTLGLLGWVRPTSSASTADAADASLHHRHEGPSCDHSNAPPPLRAFTIQAGWLSPPAIPGPGASPFSAYLGGLARSDLPALTTPGTPARLRVSPGGLAQLVRALA